MTRREAERLTHQENTLNALGFTSEEAEALRRISMQLRRWYEKECGIDGGCIERDEKTGKAFWHNSMSGKLYPIADREKGAEKRLATIIGARNARIKPTPGETRIDPVTTYLQTDPRGAALYILRPGDVPEGADEASCYSRGICVY
jgi:hypothetical protein